MALDRELPLTDSELRFWRTAALRWVRRPGLLALLLPSDLNNLTAGLILRDLACRPPPDQHEAQELAPALRDTLCFDLALHGQLRSLLGEDWLSTALGELGQPDLGLLAANGQAALYLVLSGLMLPDQLTLSQWLRRALERWPNARPAAAASRLHVCALITGPLPPPQPPLPDGCEWMALPATAPEELLPTVLTALEEREVPAEAQTRRFLALGIADLASGRRGHAQMALDHFVSEQLVSAPIGTWRPEWPSNSEAVRQAAAKLERLGLTPESLRTRHVLERHQRESTKDADISRRLWADGLWVERGEPEQLWAGLTVLARTALQVKPLQPWQPGPSLPFATQEVLMRCLHLEQELKRWLLRLLETTRGRDRIQQALDMPSALNSQYTVGDRLRLTLADFDHRLPADQLTHLETLISVASFGALKDVLVGVVAPEQRLSLLKSLGPVVFARNQAAHGWRFSLGEYKAAMEHAAIVERLISYLRWQH